MHGVETGGTVENKLNNTFVKSQHMMGGNRKCSKFANGRQSFLAAFMDVNGVLFKTLCIVPGESKIFETLH